MRVSDFIALRLKFLGCEDVFMVTGGAAMHLNDSFGKEYSGNIHTLHHEQSCAMAAESYARLKFKPAILNVTAGPGGINAINGVFGAYVDSFWTPRNRENRAPVEARSYFFTKTAARAREPKIDPKIAQNGARIGAQNDPGGLRRAHMPFQSGARI